jgi:hypothetical protein
MRRRRSGRTVDGMFSPSFREDLLRAREQEMSRRLRHAPHTAELRRSDFVAKVAHRLSWTRSVARKPNLGSAPDAASNA